MYFLHSIRIREKLDKKLGTFLNQIDHLAEVCPFSLLKPNAPIRRPCLEALAVISDYVAGFMQNEKWNSIQSMIE